MTLRQSARRCGNSAADSYLFYQPNTAFNYNEAWDCARLLITEIQRKKHSLYNFFHASIRAAKRIKFSGKRNNKNPNARSSKRPSRKMLHFQKIIASLQNTKKVFFSRIHKHQQHRESLSDRRARHSIAGRLRLEICWNVLFIVTSHRVLER